MQFTNVFRRIVEKVKDHHTIICYGGSSSSKTISILQFITIYAMKHAKKRITIASESMPVIRKTIFIDWVTHVMGDLFDYKAFNKTEMMYSMSNGSIIQFVPGDEPNRWHGLRSDITYMDEIYYIKKSIWEQAEIRTSTYLFASFNPVSPFWLQDFFNNEGVYVDHSTYKDNQFLTDKIINSLESKSLTDQNFYNVYTLGQFGTLEGGVFKEGTHWFLTDNDQNRYPDPNNVKKKIYGMDFGFSVHPSTVIEVCYSNGELYLRQLLWGTELTNPMLANRIRGLDENIIADCAEPKSIRELRNLDCNVLPSKKGRDSINFGIDVMKQFKINIDKGSIDLIKEFRNYKWDINRLDEIQPKPEDKWNHGIDAARYAITHMFAGRKEFTL